MLRKIHEHSDSKFKEIIVRVLNDECPITIATSLQNKEWQPSEETQNYDIAGFFHFFSDICDNNRAILDKIVQFKTLLIEPLTSLILLNSISSNSKNISLNTLFAICANSYSNLYLNIISQHPDMHNEELFFQCMQNNPNILSQKSSGLSYTFEKMFSRAHEKIYKNFVLES